MFLVEGAPFCSRRLHDAEKPPTAPLSISESRAVVFYRVAPVLLKEQDWEMSFGRGQALTQKRRGENEAGLF